ncbi:MAG: hypothetical protein ACRD3W_01250, partial [Terriglobales bacterium]
EGKQSASAAKSGSRFRRSEFWCSLQPDSAHCPRFGSASVSNGFSKKVENHIAMVAIHAVYYNFARIHKTLRIAPAMAAGLSDHVWGLEEIVVMADSDATKLKPRGTYKKRNAA